MKRPYRANECPARPQTRAASSRNGGRDHLGTLGGIKSEWWAPSNRNDGRDHPGICTSGASRLAQRASPSKPGDSYRTDCASSDVRTRASPTKGHPHRFLAAADQLVLVDDGPTAQRGGGPKMMTVRPDGDEGRLIRPQSVHDPSTAGLIHDLFSCSAACATRVPPQPLPLRLA
jgi:hypothetical protein